MKKLKIVGLNLNRLIQNMLKQNILPQKIERIKYDEIIVDVSNRDYKKLKSCNLLKEFNTEVVLSWSKYENIVNMFWRVGLVIGFVVALIFVVNFCNKTWQINIFVEGENVEQIKQETMLLLDELGIKEGEKINLTTKELEKELKSKLNSISVANVNKEGINLNINLKEVVSKSIFNGADIVAKYSGVIKNIDLVSGVLECDIGEAVCAGQVLISSNLIGDFYSEAVGDVVAKVNVFGDAVGAVESCSVARSGNVVQFCYLSILNEPLFCKTELSDFYSQFQNYEIEGTECFVSNNLLLPIKKVTLTAYELVEDKSFITRDNLIEKLKKEAYNNAKLSLPSGAVENNVFYDIFNDNGYYRVVCNIETEINISLRKAK